MCYIVYLFFLKLFLSFFFTSFLSVKKINSTKSKFYITLLLSLFMCFSLFQHKEKNYRNYINAHYKVILKYTEHGIFHFERNE